MASTSVSAAAEGARAPLVIRTLEEIELIREDIERDGYAAVGPVLTETELEDARRGFWDWLESLGTGIRRDDPQTWGTLDGDKRRWPDDTHGIILGAVHHAQFIWNIRQNPTIARVFIELWGTERLLVSFDRACFMRPPEYFPDLWKDFKPWPHTDQRKGVLGMECIQGLVTLHDSGPADGGLVVWPGTHRARDELGSESYELFHKLSARTLQERLELLKPYERVKVCGPAGTLFLWDSRTIHCNAAPDPDRRLEVPIPRSVVYVCMGPKSHARPEHLAAKRRQFETNEGSNHDPTGRIPVKICGAGPRNRVAPQLTQLGRRLAGLEAYPSERGA